MFNKISFGLKDGVMVDVSLVESGLACGCTCVKCGSKLQARKGLKNTHHFAHDPQSTIDCKGAAETAVHLMAKQIFQDIKKIKLPSLLLKLKGFSISLHPIEVSKGFNESVKILTNIEIEKTLGNFKPDVIAYTESGIPIIFEIAVTHFSDEIKKTKIRDRSFYAIEIDLSKINFLMSYDELKDLLINNLSLKSWLSFPAAKEAKQRLKDRLDKDIYEYDKVYNARREELYRKNKKIFKARNEAKKKADKKRLRDMSIAEKRTEEMSIFWDKIIEKQEKYDFFCLSCQRNYRFFDKNDIHEGLQCSSCKEVLVSMN